MERQITPGVKRKVIALRKKYCEGIVSDYFMRTGMPKEWKERVDEADKQIEKLLKADRKKNKEAIENAPKRKGRKTKAEERIVFI